MSCSSASFALMDLVENCAPIRARSSGIGVVFSQFPQAY